jgi:hypothetical protein
MEKSNIQAETPYLCPIAALLEDRKKKMTVGSVGFSDDIRHKIEEQLCVVYLTCI